jgi:hypothetical protein
MDITIEKLDKGIIKLNKDIKDLEKDIDICLLMKDKDKFMALTSELNEKIGNINYLMTLIKVLKSMQNVTEATDVIYNRYK